MILGKLRSFALVSPVLAALLSSYGCSSAAGLAAANSNTAASANGNTAASASGSGGSLSLAEPSTSNTNVAKIRLAILDEEACQQQGSAGSGSSSGQDQHHDPHHHPGMGSGGQFPGMVPGQLGQGQQGQSQQGQNQLGQLVSGDASQISSQIATDFSSVQSLVQLVLAEIAAGNSSASSSVAATTSSTASAGTASLVDTSTANDSSTGTATAGSLPVQCLVQHIEQAYASGTTITMANIPVGSYTLTVDLEDANGNPLEAGSTDVTITTGETATAAVTLETVQTGSVAVSISQAPATQLVFLTSSLSQTATACGLVKIEAQDANSIQALLASALSVNLTSSSTTGLFYSDAACTVAISSVSIAASAADASFYYQDATVGTLTLTATDPTSGGLSPATLSAAITAN